MRPIAFNLTGPGYQAHRDEIDGAIRGVLDASWFILGAQGEAFEREFAAYLGVPHAIGCNSGYDALVLALRALGIGAGDDDRADHPLGRPRVEHVGAVVEVCLGLGCFDRHCTMLLTHPLTGAPDLQGGEDPFVQLWPRTSKPGVQFEGLDAAERDPLEIVGLCIGGEGSDLPVRVGDHRVITPINMVIRENA